MLAFTENEILTGGTIEQELADPLFEEKQIRVFMKRDDLIHPFISGNKWRKLRYILQDVRVKGKTHILTFGGAYSNHLLATACLGALSGLRTTGIVRGEQSSELNDTLFLCQTFGMELIYVSREAYAGKEVLAEAFRNEMSYVIPEGGCCELGLKGCAELVSEFQRPYTHVLLAAGTATTATGIAMGIQEYGLEASVEAIVVLRGADYLEHSFKGMEDLPLKFHHSFHEGGYGKSNNSFLEWVKACISGTGILIEPTYTGKALKALYTLAGADYFKPGSSVLFIHTGGLLGLLGYKKKFLSTHL